MLGPEAVRSAGELSLCAARCQTSTGQAGLVRRAGRSVCRQDVRAASAVGPTGAIEGRVAAGPIPGLVPGVADQRTAAAAPERERPEGTDQERCLKLDPRAALAGRHAHEPTQGSCRPGAGGAPRNAAKEPARAVPA